MPLVGMSPKRGHTGVREIRVRQDGQFRVFYLMQLEQTIYVIHAFQKKSAKTAKKDIDLARARYKQLIEGKKMTSKTKPEKLLITKSSDNVFADLGFDTAQASNLKMRSELMIAIEGWFVASGLTQASAARLAGVTQPRFNLVLKGKINELSLDALVNIASAVGLKLKLSLSQPKTLLVKAG